MAYRHGAAFLCDKKVGIMATGLQFTFTVEGMSASTFVVTQFSGDDGLFEPFRFSIDLASRLATLTPDDVVDRQATLSVWQDGEKQQSWHGIVSRFAQKDTGHHHTFYDVQLVPPLARLALRQNSRIFQTRSVPDIISMVLQDMNVMDFAFALVRQYPQRDYCVQYRESDLAFVQRIAAEEGIFYHFSHQGGKNTVVFTDDTQNLAKLPEPLLYNVLAGGASNEPHIHRLVRQTYVRPSHTVLQDRTFTNPAYRFLNEQHSAHAAYQGSNYEHFDYGVFHGDDNNTESFTQVRLEALRSDAQTVHAHSNIPKLLAGTKFTLDAHPEVECNRDWTVVSVSHTGTQPQALEEMGGEGITTYYNQLTALQGDRAWRPRPQAKPHIDGVSVATVVGPEGEEIYCDEHGRVKVYFPWDRYNKNDDKASCWVRVSQAWAGGQFGSVMLPRIGHEVLVSYIEGDIDRPIITGCTYNAVQKPPYALPDHKTRTVLRSETHQGSGYNELYFEDQAGKEEISVHAQKDLNVLVNHDRAEQIKHDVHCDVGNARFTHIKEHDHITVDGELRQHSKGNLTQLSDGAMHFKAAQPIVLESDAGITLKVGGSFLKIDAATIAHVASTINMNSGGAPNAGTAVPPTLPHQGQETPVIPDVKTETISPLKSGHDPLMKEWEEKASEFSHFNYSI